MLFFGDANNPSNGFCEAMRGERRVFANWRVSRRVRLAEFERTCEFLRGPQQTAPAAFCRTQRPDVAGVELRGERAREAKLTKVFLQNKHEHPLRQEPARQAFYACMSRAEPVEFATNCANKEDGAPVALEMPSAVGAVPKIAFDRFAVALASSLPAEIFASRDAALELPPSACLPRWCLGPGLSDEHELRALMFPIADIAFPQGKSPVFPSQLSAFK